VTGTGRRVLVVVPTLGRRPELLALTLASITGQSEPADIVVVIPAGAAEARKLATNAGATLLDDPGSISSAINAGFASAGPHHAFTNWLGDDDLLAPDALGVAVRALDAAPDAVMSFGYCDYIDDRGRRLFTSRAGRFAPWLMTWGPNLVPQPGALIRVDALRKVGDVDETLQYAMDLDLFLRLRRMGRLVNTRTTLASFRWHADSTTVANRSKSLAESESVKRRYLSPLRRRIAPAWELPVRVATQLAARRVGKISPR
jgi:GT2 family glycosyltransferase